MVLYTYISVESLLVKLFLVKLGIRVTMPALEPQGRAWQVCGVCATKSGPNTASNPGGGQVLKKIKK